LQTQTKLKCAYSMLHQHWLLYTCGFLFNNNIVFQLLE